MTYRMACCFFLEDVSTQPLGLGYDISHNQLKETLTRLCISGKGEDGMERDDAAGPSGWQMNSEGIGAEEGLEKSWLA